MSTAHDGGTHLDVHLVRGFVYKVATVLTKRWSVLTNRVAGTHRYFRISYEDLYKNMQMRRNIESRDEYRP